MRATVPPAPSQSATCCTSEKRSRTPDCTFSVSDVKTTVAFGRVVSLSSGTAEPVRAKMRGVKAAVAPSYTLTVSALYSVATATGRTRRT